MSPHRLRKRVVLACCLLSLLSSGCITLNVGDGRDSPLDESVIDGNRGPKVLMLDIDGEITSADSAGVLGWVLNEGTVSRVHDQLALAKKKNDIKAILLRIDSPGGSPSASDAVYQQIMDFKRESSVPVVAQFMGTAASGAYLIAMAADEVVATRTSITGSIGVLLLGINLAGLMDKVGVENQTLTSGPFKDAGSILRPMKGAERAQLQSVVDDLYDQFVDVVDEGRPKLSSERVRQLADGRIYSAQQALSAGLVDRIDTLEGTIEQIRLRLGAESVRVVSYHRERRSSGNLYSRAQPPAALELSSDPLARAWPRPGFYYLWLPGSNPR